MSAFSGFEADVDGRAALGHGALEAMRIALAEEDRALEVALPAGERAQ